MVEPYTNRIRICSFLWETGSDFLLSTEDSFSLTVSLPTRIHTARAKEEIVIIPPAFFHAYAQLFLSSLCGYKLASLKNMHPFHDSAKRTQGELGDLEELLPERDSYNGDTQNQTKQKIDQGQLQPTDQEPHDVQQKRDGSAYKADFLAKWIQ